MNVYCKLIDVLDFEEFKFNVMENNEMFLWEIEEFCKNLNV